MVAATFKVRILRDRVVLETDDEPPMIVGRVVRKNGAAVLVSVSGETTPLVLDEIEGGRR